MNSLEPEWIISKESRPASQNFCYNGPDILTLLPVPIVVAAITQICCCSMKVATDTMLQNVHGCDPTKLYLQNR